MKKYFLFGLGLLLTGSVLAATVSTVTIVEKDPGDPVSNEEFNAITTGINALTDMFDSSTSDAAGIAFPKNLEIKDLMTMEIVPSQNNSYSLGSTTARFKDLYVQKIDTHEICLNNQCETSWDSGGGTIDQECSTGKVVKGIASGTFECITPDSGEDNLGNHTATADLTSFSIIPDMTGATELVTGDGSFLVSQRDLGSPIQWFRNLYVKDVNMTGHTLYMDGAAVLQSDPALGLRFTADDGQDMSLKSKNHLNILIPTTGSNSSNINIINEAKGGKILLEAATIDVGLDPEIVLDSPVVTTTGDLEITGDINFTGGLYQNEVLFEGGGSGIVDHSCDIGEVVTGIAGGTFICTGEPFCEDLEYHQCVGGDLYWFDSCDVQGIIKETCSDGCTEAEQDGICSAPCDDFEYHQCVGGNLYWFDSCDVQSTIKETCSGGCTEAEQDGACFTPEDPNAPYTFESGEWGPCGEEYQIEYAYEKTERALKSVAAMKEYYVSGDGVGRPEATDSVTSLGDIEDELNAAANKIVDEKIKAYEVTKKTDYTTQEDSNDDGLLLWDTSDESDVHSFKAKKKTAIQTRDIFCANKFGIRTEDAYCKDATNPFPSEGAVRSCNPSAPGTYGWSVGSWSECGSLPNIVKTKNDINAYNNLATTAETSLTTALSIIQAEIGSVPTSVPTSAQVNLATSSTARKILLNKAKYMALNEDKITAVARKVAPADSDSAYPAFSTFTTDLDTFVDSTNGSVKEKAQKEKLGFQTREIFCVADIGTFLSEDFCLDKKPVVYRNCQVAPTILKQKWIIDGWSASCNGEPSTKTRSVRCTWCTADLCVVGDEGDPTDNAVCTGASLPIPATSKICNIFDEADVGTEITILEDVVSNSVTISDINSTLSATTATADAADAKADIATAAAVTASTKADAADAKAVTASTTAVTADAKADAATATADVADARAVTASTQATAAIRDAADADAVATDAFSGADQLIQFLIDGTACGGDDDVYTFPASFARPLITITPKDCPPSVTEG